MKKFMLLCLAGIFCNVAVLATTSVQALSMEINSYSDMQNLQTAVHAQQAQQNFNSDRSYASSFDFQNQENASRELAHALNTGINAGTGAPQNRFVFVPKFFTTHNEGLSNLTDASLNCASGSSKGGGGSLIVSRQFTPTFSATLIYDYQYTDYKGGIMVPQSKSTPAGKLNFAGDSHQWTTGNSFLLIVKNSFGSFGALQLSSLLSLGENGGSETFTTSSDTATLKTDRRNVRSSSTIKGLTLSYTKDIQLNDAWSITPFIGYNPTHVSLEKLNNFQAAPGTYMDTSSWSHLAFGGLSMRYRSGLIGVEGHAGVSHFLSGGRNGGFMVRNMTHDTTQAGFNVGADRTVGTFGAALTYGIPGFGLISVKYSGMLGERTNGHTGSIALIIPF